MPLDIYILLVLTGILGGFMSGLVGIGGGIVYVFVIPYAISHMDIPSAWQAQVIIANSLAAIFFSSLAANYTHYKKGYFFPREIVIIGLSAIVSSWVSLEYFVNTPLFSMKLFLVLLILLMLYMLVYTLRGAALITDKSVGDIPLWGLVFIGLISGIVASASGLGGGIVVIPLLNRFFGINIKKASAISLGVIMLSSLTITLANAMVLVQGNFAGNYGLIIPVVCITLSLSVVFSSPLGVMLAHKLSSRSISLVYAFILLIVIINKTFSLLSITGYISS